MSPYRALMNVSWALLGVSIVCEMATILAGPIALCVSIGVFAAALGCGVAAIYIDTHADREDRPR